MHELVLQLPVQLTWTKDPAGYAVVDQPVRRPRTFLDDDEGGPVWRVLVGRSRGRARTEYSAHPHFKKIVVEFLNAREPKAVVAFANKWGLPRGGTGIPLKHFDDDRRLLWDKLLESMQFHRGKNDETLKFLRNFFGAEGKFTSDLKIEPQGQSVARLVLRPTNLRQFALIVLWCSATGNAMVVPCEAGCGKAVSIKPGVRPRRFCPGGACQMRAKRRAAKVNAISGDKQNKQQARQKKVG
jgi:hypothetical protein